MAVAFYLFLIISISNFFLICSEFTRKLEESDSIRISNVTDVPTINLSETFDFPPELSSSDEYPEISDSANETDNNPPSKYILVGFGNYNRKDNVINFYVYFKRISGNTPPNLSFPAAINFVTQLRLLEEYNITCERISEDDNSYMKYNCTTDGVLYQTISSFSLKEDFYFDGIKQDVILSSLASKTKDNIQNQIEDKLNEGYYVLENCHLEKNSKSFNITGDITGNITGIQPTKFEANRTTLLLDENENGKFKYVDCNIINIQDKKYQLFCYPQSSISAHLSGATGEVDNKTLLIETIDDDLVDIQYIIPEEMKKSLKKGRLALILGIAIPFAFIIITGVILAIIFRKKKATPVPMNSKLDLYQSNTSQT